MNVVSIHTLLGQALLENQLQARLPEEIVQGIWCDIIKIIEVRQ